MGGIEIIATVGVSMAVTGAALMAVAKSLAKHEFKCPKCGHVTKFTAKELFFKMHDENIYYINCPECGYEKMCMK